MNHGMQLIIFIESFNDVPQLLSEKIDKIV